MKKVIIVPDLHGKTCWEKIEIEKYDKIIFLGDYVDAYNVSDEQIVGNLTKIIELKKSNPDKIILLLANHDIQYFFLGEGFSCSGYRGSYATVINQLFQTNKELFQIAYQIDNHLFTHAGVSNRWYGHLQEESKYIEYMETDDIATKLNKIFLSNEKYILFSVGPLRGGDRYDYGGVIWADINETMHDPLKGYNQYVGHSKVPDFIYQILDEKTSITYLDVLDTVEKFYEFEITV